MICEIECSFEFLVNKRFVSKTEFFFFIVTFHISLNRSKRRKGCFDFSLFTDQKRRKDHHRLQWGFDKRSLSHVSDQALLAVVDMPIIHFILLRSFWSKTGARTSSNNEKLDSA